MVLFSLHSIGILYIYGTYTVGYCSVYTVGILYIYGTEKGTIPVTSYCFLYCILKFLKKLYFRTIDGVVVESNDEREDAKIKYTRRGRCGEEGLRG